MKVLAPALLSLTLAGCGTMIDLTAQRPSPLFGPGPVPHVFGGVRVDAVLMEGNSLIGLLCVLDLPLSFVLDVALLPVSIPVECLASPEPKDVMEPPK